MSRIKKVTYKGVNFDSKAEYEFGLTLESGGVNLKASRESTILEYLVPERTGKYFPDFSIGRIHLEYKGRFTKKDRDKLLYVKHSHPGERIILIFGRAANLLYKGSKTTYGEWATKNGFEWYDSTIPLSRLKELLKNANKKRT